MDSPFLWGPNGQKAGLNRDIAGMLAGVQPIDNPMQGAAMMAQAAVDRYNANPLNQFPDAPGNNPFSGLFGLGSRLLGGSGGLY